VSFESRWKPPRLIFEGKFEAVYFATLGLDSIFPFGHMLLGIL
jgi:hypothetical protein